VSFTDEPYVPLAVHKMCVHSSIFEWSLVLAEVACENQCHTNYCDSYCQLLADAFCSSE